MQRGIASRVGVRVGASSAWGINEGEGIEVLLYLETPSPYAVWASLWGICLAFFIASVALRCWESVLICGGAVAVVMADTAVVVGAAPLVAGLAPLVTGLALLVVGMVFPVAGAPPWSRLLRSVPLSSNLVRASVKSSLSACQLADLRDVWEEVPAFGAIRGSGYMSTRSSSSIAGSRQKEQWRPESLAGPVGPSSTSASSRPRSVKVVIEWSTVLNLLPVTSRGRGRTGCAVVKN